MYDHQTIENNFQGGYNKKKIKCEHKMMGSSVLYSVTTFENLKLASIVKIKKNVSITNTMNN